MEKEGQKPPLELKVRRQETTRSDQVINAFFNQVAADEDMEDLAIKKYNTSVTQNDPNRQVLRRFSLIEAKMKMEMKMQKIESRKQDQQQISSFKYLQALGHHLKNFQTFQLQEDCMSPTSFHEINQTRINNVRISDGDTDYLKDIKYYKNDTPTDLAFSPSCDFPLEKQQKLDTLDEVEETPRKQSFGCDPLSGTSSSDIESLGEEPNLHDEQKPKSNIDSEGYRKSSEKSNFMDNVKSESNPFSLAM